MEMLDTVGVPEYFATHVGAVEDAGCGMVRIIRCVVRRGELVPVFSCVIPAMSMLQSWPRMYEMAKRLACSETIGAMVN